MCDCDEARRWRAYWTAEAIAERLVDELDLLRRTAAAEVTRAFIATSHDVHAGLPRSDWPSFAELETRRAAVYDWRAHKR